MPWAANPVFKLESPAENRLSDVEAAQATRETGEERSGGTAAPDFSSVKNDDDDDSGFRTPTDKFSGHQLFYIFILDGIIAALLSGGINFAIAFGMSHSSDPFFFYRTAQLTPPLALYHNKGGYNSPIRLFKFPNTLAGDAAITVFIQFLVTWIIESVLVNRDLKKGAVQPIGFLPEPTWKLVRWFMFLDRRKQTHEVRSFKHWLEYLFSQTLRSLILAVIFFPLIFGASIGFLTLVGRRRGGDWYYAATWTPEIFKAVQGAVLGLLFTPPMVMFWLARCGWALRKNAALSE